MCSLVASEKTGERGFLYYFSRPVCGRFRQILRIHENAICNVSQYADMLSENIQKQDTPMRMVIPPCELLGTYASFSSYLRVISVIISSVTNW